jgi:hypothetical protein
MAPKAGNRTSRLAPLNLRTTEEMRAKLEEAAAAAGRNLTQEVEFRLNRDLSWEATKQDIERLRAEAATALEATRIQAIRQAGFQIVREAGGGVSVNVSPELLHAEADDIMRSGLVDTKPDQGGWTKPATELEPRPVATVVDLEALMEKVIERVIARLSRPSDDDFIHEAKQYQKPPKRSRSKLQVERDTELKPRES